MLIVLLYEALMFFFVKYVIDLEKRQRILQVFFSR